MSFTSLRVWSVVLPALVVILLAVNAVWDYPHEDLPIDFLSVLGVFVIFMLNVRLSKQQNTPPDYAGFLGSDGTDPDTGTTNLKLVITKTPDELLSANEVRLKIGLPPEVKDSRPKQGL